MDLNTIWFILIAVLFTGFFFLEGFDYGVGILLPFLTKEDQERRIIVNTIGPFWDANEVWLITAGGAMFAAFPHWYATLFSGFYLPLFLILLALILRGVAFEFRSKDSRPAWRRMWDWMIFLGSLIPAFLWGVAMANLIRGVPINQNMTYVGGFWNLLNPFALISGITSTTFFALHGANFLTLKTSNEVMNRTSHAAARLWPVALAAILLAAVVGYYTTDIFTRAGVVSLILPLLAILAIPVAGWTIRLGQSGRAFALVGVSIALSTVTLFMNLFPNVMISSLDPAAWSLTIYNAASSAYTLRVMSIIALIFIPVVLAYQAWSYYIFRKRITSSSTLEY
jgi:cytochrome d ubiquinol oxidase subunit II